MVAPTTGGRRGQDRRGPSGRTGRRWYNRNREMRRRTADHPESGDALPDTESRLYRMPASMSRSHAGGVAGGAVRTGGTGVKAIRTVMLLSVLGTGLAGSCTASGAEPINPVPPPPPEDPARIALGRALFVDTKLSRDGTIACSSCHILAEGGADGRQVSLGIEGKKGNINAPTVFNAGLLNSQFWDGRKKTLEDQIDGPIQNPVEMGNEWGEVLIRLYDDPEYGRQFQALEPESSEPITRETVKRAIAAFVRSLNTTNGRFDRWLKGEEDPETKLTERELEGYRLFKHYGCSSCHQGAAVGGNMFQVFGVINNYFTRRGSITDADRGRFMITGNIEDMHSFKVPSLRMAALTPPYLHDGTAKTLRDAVDAMFMFQLGIEAPDDHKDAIVAFLRTLPGEHPELEASPAAGTN